ncbi:MAG TPA: hypothetical protein VKU93_10790 [Terracidiphilus sp.]|jgi:hypothetical protein|nr:hypothetical protein [Terracidiphilus sp.]
MRPARSEFSPVFIDINMIVCMIVSWGCGGSKLPQAKAEWREHGFLSFHLFHTPRGSVAGRARFYSQMKSTP